MRVIYPDDHEMYVVRRLVTALVQDWDAIPKNVQDRLVRTAALAFDPDLSRATTGLERDVRVFIHDHQARAAERPQSPRRSKI